MEEYLASLRGTRRGEGRAPIRVLVPHRSPGAVTGGDPDVQLPDNWYKIVAEREGFEPDSDPKSDQQVTDSENNSVPEDPPNTP